MRVIPAAVETLLKSRAQAGANAHNHLITIGGKPTSTSLLDPASWTTWQTFVDSGRTSGNMTATADGRAVIVYVESGAVKLAYADSVPEILDGTKTFNTAGATTLISGLTGAQTSIDLIDGKLNICITHILTELCAEFWRDTDGNGTGMAYVSTISADLSSEYAYGAEAGPPCSMIHRLGASTLVVMVPWQYHIKSSMRCCYSLDDGITWILGGIVTVGLGDNLGVGSSKSFLILDDTSFIVSYLTTSAASWLCYFTNSGSTYAKVNYIGDWDPSPNFLSPKFVSFITLSEAIYLAYYSDAYEITIKKFIEEIPTIVNVPNVINWELVCTVESDEGAALHHFTLTKDSLILQHSKGNLISGAGTTINTASVRAKRIEINRNKGMASSATVVFDNKAGIYSPDKAVGAAWKNIMWPNNGIVIEQGYGQELVTTFTGTIDDVIMTTFPAEITLVCRDYMKRAYDQLITSGGTHSITYNNFTPEAMFTDLATKAGWAGADIHTEVTGLTIAEKIYQNETYGDAFSWLADMCGFMVFCDEDGDIYYIKDDDDAVPTSDYAFAEGEDIISLGYTISDRDLYNKIICIGDGVSYEVTYYNTYNILAAKKMIINASEATTEAQCQAIAEQARYVMNARARICEFAAICNPYLQIGDTLTVTETTTLISELYKITDISTVQSPDGYIAHITCYHYAAPAES